MLKQTLVASRIAALTLGALVASGCSIDNLVLATDPDIIGVELVNSPSAANAMRIGTLGRLNISTTGSESMFLYGGLFGDEFGTGDTFTQRIETDQRALTPENGNITTAYRDVHRARMGAIQSREALATYAPLAPAWNYGEMFFVEGYMLNLLAEHFCNGQPISTINNGVEEYGDPQSSAQIFTLALAKVDSGLARLGAATGTNETRVRNSLQILRARILINQGNFTAVQAAVASVPTSFTWNQEHSLTSRTPGVWSLINNQRRYIVSNNEGPLGLNFGTANDPRVPTCSAGQAACTAAGFTTSRPFDSGNTSVPNMLYQLIWPTDASAVSLMNGLQARLYEAEALNRADNFAGALTILNALRAAPPSYTRTIAAMPALTDPGTAAARRDLIFREKAFWLFGTGHRYPDMRRMMRQYGMTANQVFPNGATWQINRAPGYSTDIVFRIPTAETFNPRQPIANGAALCTDNNP
jgi:starch-binding outer membrane protein, SusD/RagB family